MEYKKKLAGELKESKGKEEESKENKKVADLSADNTPNKSKLLIKSFSKLKLEQNSKDD